jgi:pyrimidine operon attenuation protein/uracil phosphoribosyltransferase
MATTPTTSTTTTTAATSLSPTADFMIAPIGHDCCDGGMNLGQTEIKNPVSLFVQLSDKKYIHDLPVQVGKTFAKGELATIVLGTITKLAAAPVPADNLCIIHYRLDTTPATTALGNATARANVISACSGLNEKAVILPTGVVFTDDIRGILASKNIYTANGTNV